MSWVCLFSSWNNNFSGYPFGVSLSLSICGGPVRFSRYLGFYFFFSLGLACEFVARCLFGFTNVCNVLFGWMITSFSASLNHKSVVSWMGG